MRTDSELLGKLTEIEKKLSGLSQEEKDNLFLDLEAVDIRIRTDAYKESDYIQRNTWDMPRRIRDFFHCIRRYYAHALSWEKILSRYDLSKTSTILDLCPGNGPKACIALTYLGYRGDLYNLDKDQDALAMLEVFISMLRPPYRPHYLHQDLYSVPLKGIDLILANHIIDDLLLDDYCREHGLDIYEIYENKDLFLDTINKILRYTNKASFARRVAETLDLTAGPQADIVFCHYSGLVEGSFGIQYWADFCGEVLDTIVHNLADKGYSIERERIDNSMYYFVHKQV